MVLIPIKLLSSPYSLKLEMGSLQYSGVIPVLIGVTTLLWCLWEFIRKGKGTPALYHPPKELVVSGLYKFKRNPMYGGIICVLFGEAIFSGSALLLCYAGLIFVIFHLWVILTEEPYLRTTFGEPYKRYCESVPRWLIRLK